VGLAGCGDGAGEGAAPGRIEIRRANGDPVGPTGDFELEPGSQGGFHIAIQLLIDAEARSFFGDRSFHRHIVRRVDDDALLSRREFDVPWTVSERPGWSELSRPLFVFLCPTPIGLAAADRELRVSVSVGEPDGVRPLATTATVTARCPGGQPGEFCDRICRG